MQCEELFAPKYLYLALSFSHLRIFAIFVWVGAYRATFDGWFGRFLACGTCVAARLDDVSGWGSCFSFPACAGPRAIGFLLCFLFSLGNEYWETQWSFMRLMDIFAWIAAIKISRSEPYPKPDQNHTPKRRTYRLGSKWFWSGSFLYIAWKWCADILCYLIYWIWTYLKDAGSDCTDLCGGKFVASMDSRDWEEDPFCDVGGMISDSFKIFRDHK